MPSIPKYFFFTLKGTINNHQLQLLSFEAKCKKKSGVLKRTDRLKKQCNASLEHVNLIRTLIFVKKGMLLECNTYVINYFNKENSINIKDMFYQF